jgi:hypothetical protein
MYLIKQCVLSLLSAVVLLPDPTDALCTSFIWLLGIGFVLTYGYVIFISRIGYSMFIKSKQDKLTKIEN